MKNPNGPNVPADVEDRFFGEIDPFKERDNKPGVEALATEHSVHEVSNTVQTAVDNVRQFNTVADVLDRLQEGGILPESMHTDMVAKVLHFLGTKFDLQFQIDDAATLFPNNKTVVRLSTDKLRSLLVRGAAGLTVLAPVMLRSSTALAAELTVGEPVSQAPIATIYHWDYLVMAAAALALLGVGGYMVNKIIKKRKKNQGEKTKEIMDTFEELKNAKRRNNPEEAKKLEENLYTQLTAELPDTAGEIIGDEPETPSKKDLQLALDIKKEVDDSTDAVLKELSEEMEFPENPTLHEIQNKKGIVSEFAKEKLEELVKLRDKIQTLINKFKTKKGKEALVHLLEFELKKLNYMIAHVKTINLKWLALGEMKEDEYLADEKNAELLEKPGVMDSHDKNKKAYLDLQKELKELLKKQMDMAPEAFEEKIAMVDESMTDSEEKLDKKHLDVVSGKILHLSNGGKYNSETPIQYEIEEDSKHEIPLMENVEVQMWVDVNKKIFMNFNHNGVLLHTDELVINDAGTDLVNAKDKFQALKAKIEEYQNGIKPVEEEESEALILASKELSPESGPVIAQLSEAVTEINKQISSGEYGNFGKHVLADDDAINYHLIRIHREYFQGAPKTVIRFQLTDKYAKKALASLDKQPDVPNHSVPFKYENAIGGKKDYAINMREFNVSAGDNKNARVILPENGDLMAISGEVRLILDPDVDYTKEDIGKLMGEVASRLEIAQHIKPVTEEAEEKLKAHLKEISKTGGTPTYVTAPIHGEYQASQVSKETVEKMKEKGLHSVYHQISLSNLEAAFKCGNVLSTTTRWSKGILEEGMSSDTDLANDGASEVFSRIHTNDSAKNNKWYSNGSKPAVIFGPETFERLDCYCYASDKFGSKATGTFGERISPEKLVDTMVSSYHAGNEVMFYDAMDLSKAKYIVFDDKEAVIAKLKAAGVKTLGGKPLDEAVVTQQEFSQIKNI